MTHWRGGDGGGRKRRKGSESEPEAHRGRSLCSGKKRAKNDRKRRRLGKPRVVDARYRRGGASSSRSTSSSDSSSSSKKSGASGPVSERPASVTNGDNHNFIVAGLQFEGMRVRQLPRRGRVPSQIIGEDAVQSLKLTFSNGASVYDDSREIKEFASAVPLQSTHINPLHRKYLERRLKSSCFTCGELSHPVTFEEPCGCPKPVLKSRSEQGSASYCFSFRAQRDGVERSALTRFFSDLADLGLARERAAAPERRNRGLADFFYDVNVSDIQRVLANCVCDGLDAELERCFIGRIPLLPRSYRCMQSTNYSKLATAALSADQKAIQDGTSWKNRGIRDKAVARALSALIQPSPQNKVQAAQGDEGDLDDERLSLIEAGGFVPKSVVSFVRKIGRLGERFVNSCRGVAGPSANRVVRGYAGPVCSIDRAHAMTVLQPRLLLPLPTDIERAGVLESDRRRFLIECVGRGALDYVGAGYLTIGGREIALTTGSEGWTCHAQPDGTVDTDGVEAWLSVVWPMRDRAHVPACVGRHTCEGDEMFFWRSPVNTPGSLGASKKVRVSTDSVITVPEVQISVMDADSLDRAREPHRSPDHSILPSPFVELLEKDRARRNINN